MKQQVTLSLALDCARAVVVEEERVVSWGSVALAPGLDNGNYEEAGRQIGGLLQSLGVQPKQVVVDFHHTSILGRYLYLPKMHKRYMSRVVPLELKETVPFSIDELDISWQAVRNGQGWHVLSFCMPTDMADSYVRALRAVNVVTKTVYPRPLALAHAVGMQDAIILSLEPGEAEIIVVVGSVPRIIYHSLVDLGPNYNEKALNDLAADVERLLQSSESPEFKALGDVPVVPVGSLAEDALFTSQLANALDREMQPLKPALQCPVDFPSSEYAANLGLASATRRGASPSLFPAINVLPARYRPAPFPWRQIAVFSLLAIAAAAAPVAGRQLNEKAAYVSSLEGQLDLLQGQTREERLRLNEVSALRQQTDRVQSLTQRIDAHLSQLASRRASLVQRLKVSAIESVPQGVVLDSVGDNAGGLALRGQAPSYYDALRYVEQLRASGAFLKVDLKEARAFSGGVSFQVSAAYQDGKAAAKP